MKNSILAIALFTLLSACSTTRVPQAHALVAGDAVRHRATGSNGVVLEASKFDTRIVVDFPKIGPARYPESELEKLN